jgi:hypothetical protein
VVVKQSSRVSIPFMSKNHVHTGLFIPEAAAMEMQGLQEMQAGDGCVLSSGFIHPPL